MGGGASSRDAFHISRDASRISRDAFRISREAFRISREAATHNSCGRQPAERKSSRKDAKTQRRVGGERRVVAGR